ncbi:MAG: hypothetical protein ACYC4R_02410 [Anaerolineae bacterium]
MDDEYFSFVVRTHCLNNPVAVAHFEKVMRALGYNPELVSFFTPGYRPVLYNGDLTGVFQADLDRLERIADHMARGLYYHHCKSVLKERCRHLGQVHIQYPGLLFPPEPENAPVNTAKLIISEALRQVRGHLPKYGHNPKVFYYQVTTRDEPREVMLTMVFYEGVAIVARLIGAQLPEMPHPGGALRTYAREYDNRASG